MTQTDLVISTADEFSLAATQFQPAENVTNTLIIINSATGVPRHFYNHFATFLATSGYTTLTYDYRGIGESRPRSLRGFDVKARDWTLKDMTAVLEWAFNQYQPNRLFFIGHSYGGQMVGLLPNRDKIDALATFSSQSGYWQHQGGNQKWPVAFHMYMTLPILSNLLGYMPWSLFGKAEDLPKGVALEWSRWCRDPHYLLGDSTLPLDRYQSFTAPVLAYSFDDDDWGTPTAVDTMMQVYPNLTRQHIIPAELGTNNIGHFGAFRPKSQQLWEKTLNWLEETIPAKNRLVQTS